MVTPCTERRDKSEWSLSRIHELAAAQAIIYSSSRVQNTTSNLGYGIEAVCECLLKLTPGHFQHSVLYPDSKYWLDVYCIRYRGPTDQDDPLYIKLRLNRDCIQIVLCSFHLEGAL
jgi:Motility quorum-sensing regulator, toxin of MqsA